MLITAGRSSPCRRQGARIAHRRGASPAEFYNIDIDTSTLVDLDFATRDEQQRANYEYTAHLTKYIRERQPEGIHVSVGGEIGEVGKYNTQPLEVRAYMEGLRKGILDGEAGHREDLGADRHVARRRAAAGRSIAQAKIDFEVLREVTRICRSEYGVGGSVQHGASTLPGGCT